MANQASHLGPVTGRYGQQVVFKPVVPRRKAQRIVRCSDSRTSTAGKLRVGDAGAALLGCFAVLPQKVIAGELMVFDSAPEFSAPSLPAIPVDVASKLPSVSFEPIQQVSYLNVVWCHHGYVSTAIWG
jgi:hypothetical protein